MPKYKVSANETYYYVSKEVEADSCLDAEAKYLAMIEEGNVETNSTDLQDVIVEQIG